MFSSIASFIFGSNTSATANSEANQNPTTTPTTTRPTDQDQHDAENTIEVTSSTPSVTGTSNNSVSRQGKRSRNRRNRNKNNKRQGGGQAVEGPRTSTPTITKLLTPNDSFEDDFDEDDWFIVDKDDEEDSLPRTDSEEELSLVEAIPKPAPAPVPYLPPAVQQQQQQQQRRRQHINSHSLYSGPRPQQQRNYIQRSRNSGARGAATGTLNVSALSPPRSIAGAVGGGAAGAAKVAAATPATADGSVTQSLYVTVPSYRDVAVAGAAAAHNTSSSSTGSSNLGANCSMDESWFVTPPPCFTSIGPINMETSPFENLLIEHPSMSVYHSIRSAQEATESFVNLDLGVQESQRRREAAEAAAEAAVEAAAQAQIDRDTQAVQQRTAGGARLDRFSAAQVKQELLARSTQKYHDNKDRQSLCRGAIKRANKVRDFQAKGNRQRRSDMQHCKIVSGANNNRKCCY